VSHEPVPAGAALDAAGAALGPLRRHRRLTWSRFKEAAVPYGLIAPALIVIIAVLGYPIYWLGRLSVERYGLAEIIQHKGPWIGLHNFTTIFTDPQFWSVVLRSVLFTAVNVGLTMLLGTLIAFLLKELGKFMRMLVTSALVLAWSMPVVVATQIWLWMTNYENGVVNYLMTQFGFRNFVQYDWFANTTVGFGLITSLIVWGAVPFVAVTVFAGLTQVPKELLEAAEIDGSGTFRRFRDITFPILKPIFVILTSLSVIWDFQVFTQPFLLLSSRPDPGYWLMSIYAYEKSFSLHDYGLGSAIALVMMAIMVCVTFFYVRQMIRIGEVQ
jgi:N,N'-diacetylchitobiose transport system permease protein